jgi:hypothetical protein
MIHWRWNIDAFWRIFSTGRAYPCGGTLLNQDRSVSGALGGAFRTAPRCVFSYPCGMVVHRMCEATDAENADLKRMITR